MVGLYFCHTNKRIDPLFNACNAHLDQMLAELQKLSSPGEVRIGRPFAGAPCAKCSLLKAGVTGRKRK